MWYDIFENEMNEDNGWDVPAKYQRNVVLQIDMVNIP